MRVSRAGFDEVSRLLCVEFPGDRGACWPSSVVAGGVDMAQHSKQGVLRYGGDGACASCGPRKGRTTALCNKARAVSALGGPQRYSKPAVACFPGLMSPSAEWAAVNLAMWAAQCRAPPMVSCLANVQLEPHPVSICPSAREHSKYGPGTIPAARGFAKSCYLYHHTRR